MGQLRKNKTQAAQVYFPKSVYFQIKMRASQVNQPTTAWIRNIVIQELGKQKRKAKKLSDMPTFSVPEFKNFKPEDIDKIVYDL